MKNIFILTLALCIYGFANGQQIHQLTQYSMNDFVYNPAVAGSNDLIEAKLNLRKQWVGFDDGDSPFTQFISAHSRLPQFENVGVGAIFYNDQTGPTARSGLKLVYAYQLPLDEGRENVLSLGIGATVMQQRVNFSDLDPRDIDDVVVGSGKASKMGFDADFGAYLYGEDYYLGASVNQLLATKFKIEDAESLENSRHLFLSAGYNFDLSEEFAIEPMVFAKMVSGADAQFDFGARGIYEDAYWLGLNYRTSDAISILAGVTFDDMYHLAYSYDITTSEIKDFSTGSHELSFGIDFDWGYSYGSDREYDAAEPDDPLEN